MKHLSSLTTFFITFLFVAYLGIFAGLKINNYISDKKLVIASDTGTPVISPSAQPSPTPSITTVAQAPQKQVQTNIPDPAVDTATPAPDPAANNPTPPPAPDPTAPPPAPEPSVPAPDPRCIITLSGGQYDITQFQNSHSGGNTFQCGTDMTAALLAQHSSSYIQKMSQYKI